MQDVFCFFVTGKVSALKCRKSVIHKVHALKCKNFVLIKP